jgi:hypothetical protein
MQDHRAQQARGESTSERRRFAVLKRKRGVHDISRDTSISDSEYDTSESEDDTSESEGDVRPSRRIRRSSIGGSLDGDERESQ